MLVSYRWLSRHVDLSGISPEQVATALTLSTAEVEGRTQFGQQWAGVVIGRVLAKQPHPNADRLSLCEVDAGSGAPLAIVCGAPNVAAGQEVALATDGSVLPGGLAVKVSTIRGVRSQGMICSEKELGLGDDDAGIWLLTTGAPPGTSLAKALDLDDWVIEIDNKSLTHRPDLWGHRGIAAELAAIFRRTLLPLGSALPSTGAGRPWPVAIESPKCTRYVALAIENVRLEVSPLWLRKLLLAVGQRPANVIVDLSNFVMLDIGQPNHTFDRASLHAQPIVVRDARAGEHMTTLDGVARALLPSDLLICAGERPVALAGVIGGEGSRITSVTSDVLLESATFQPTPIRRTAARLGARTDASARFEKTLDPALALQAAQHFARLLHELQPQIRLPAPPTDVGDWQRPPTLLELDNERIRRDLGVSIGDAEIADILTRLGFSLRGGGTQVEVPSNRATKDVSLDRDLVEEVGRIYLYGNIPEQELPPARALSPDPRRALQRAIEDRLASAAAFHEMRSYSFQSDELLAIVGLDAAPHVRVTDPVVAGQGRIRRAVLPSVLATLEPNRRLRAEVRLFEIGKGYYPEQPNARHEPREVHELALVLARAAAGERSFQHDALRQLQGILVDLIAELGLRPLSWQQGAADAGWAHPVRQLEARFTESDPEPALLLAEVRPQVAAALGLRGALQSEVVAASVSIDRLLLAPKQGRRYRPKPRYPAVAIDVAVAAPVSSAAREIERCIAGAAGPLQLASQLFDVYEGKSLGAGRKSLAYHVTLGSDERTLSEVEVQGFLQRLSAALQAIGAELRSK